MFDIGFSEMIILGLVALIVIGPKELPEVARMAARFINDVKRITGEFTGQIMTAKETANKFIHETQTQVLDNLDPTSRYKPEAVVPPPHEGPLPAPEPATEMAAHAPDGSVADVESRQMTLDLDASEKKGPSGS